MDEEEKEDDEVQKGSPRHHFSIAFIADALAFLHVDEWTDLPSTNDLCRCCQRRTLLPGTIVPPPATSAVLLRLDTCSDSVPLAGQGNSTSAASVDKEVTMIGATAASRASRGTEVPGDEAPRVLHASWRTGASGTSKMVVVVKGERGRKDSGATINISAQIAINTDASLLGSGCDVMIVADRIFGGECGL